LQSILKNISVEGNLTTGDISQILNLFVIVQQPNSFIPKSTPYNIPSSNTIKFVGRTDTLEQLHQALQQNSQVAITTIEGMGGVGKTELATQYSLLHLLLNTYPGGICWLRVRDEDIGTQILRFAEAKLGIKPPEDWDIKSQVEFCWSRWQEKKEGNVLIILDDVNDYPKIQPYLPPQLSQFKVLITTRLLLDLPQSFLLNILSESASLELLRQWIGEDEDKVNKELAEAKELCLRLGYLPLALNLVGRYIQKRKISLAEMLQRLEEKGLKHPALDVNKKDRTLTLDIKRGVAAAFELSWEELSENAKKLGCLLSLFPFAPVPWDFVKEIDIQLDFEYIEEAKIELASLYLIQIDEIKFLHQLIHEFFANKLLELQDKEEFICAIKNSADKLISKNDKLQNLLQWIEKKSINEKSCCIFIIDSLPQIKAYYLDLFFSYEVNIENQFILNPTVLVELNLYNKLHLEEDNYLPHNLLLDRFLWWTLAYVSSSTRIDFAFGYQFEIGNAISLASDQCKILLKLQLIPLTFYEAILNLWQKLPNLDNSSKDIFIKWWQANGEAWISELKTLIIDYRDIGHDWIFTEEEKSLFQKYYDRNELLINCLDNSLNYKDYYYQKTVNNLFCSIPQQ